MPKHFKMCPHCRSEKIQATFHANWNVGHQEWDIAGLAKEAFRCTNCNTDFYVPRVEPIIESAKPKHLTLRHLNIGDQFELTASVSRRTDPGILMVIKDTDSHGNRIVNNAFGKARPMNAGRRVKLVNY